MAHPSADLYGSDRVLLETVSSFVDAGWRVLVTIPADGPLVPLLRERGAVVVLSPTPVLRKSYLSPRGLVTLAVLAARALWSNSRLISQHKPALLLVNTITIPLWLLVGRLRGLRVVCHVHEAEGSASIWLRRALALPLLLAHLLVVNSRFSEGVLTSAFRGLGRRTTVVYNGVPGPAHRVPPRPVLTPPVRVLYVGRLSHRKGVDVVVDAVGVLADRGVQAVLDVVGAVFPGYEWYEAELRQRAQDLGLVDAVRYRGFVPEIWDTVAESDVMVVPSRGDEPFGNTVVEGILAARPVIASASSGLLEAASGYQAARTVPPGDPVALANEIERVIQNWDVLRDAVLQDAERAEEKHGPRRYRSEILSAVTGVLASSVRR
jgi:glycosyltransferase involved in cell wall biosynthesis